MWATSTRRSPRCAPGSARAAATRTPGSCRARRRRRASSTRCSSRYGLWKDDPGGDRFVALLDGEIVGSGGARYFESGIYLLGGNVAEHARGRGVYRALVRARWDESVRRGTPALVVHAGAMSRPILEHVGFRTVSEVHALLDSTR